MILESGSNSCISRAAADESKYQTEASPRLGSGPARLNKSTYSSGCIAWR